MNLSESFNTIYAQVYKMCKQFPFHGVESIQKALQIDMDIHASRYEVLPPVVYAIKSFIYRDVVLRLLKTVMEWQIRSLAILSFPLSYL